MSTLKIAHLIRRGVLVAAGIVCIASLSACGGGSSAPDAPPVPQTPSAPPAQVAPTITTQPQTQSVQNGMAATFSVSAQGGGPYTYQWSRNGTPITGATAASYTTPNVALADSADVLRVSVANDKGTVTSDAAAVLVDGVGVRRLAGNYAPIDLARMDGLGKEGRFESASAMALDSTGNLLVGETGRRVIRKVTPTGAVTTWLTGAEGGTGLHYPRDIAVGANGVVYVTDGATADRASTLRKIDANGTISTIALPRDAGDPVGSVDAPFQTQLTALAADTAGNVYVATEIARPGPATCSSCFSRNTVRKIAPDGTITLLFAVDGPAGQRFVYSMAVDKSGNLFLLDAVDIFKIDAAGKVSSLMPNGGAFLTALTVDGAGNVYFAGPEFSGRISSWPWGALGKISAQGGTVLPVADPREDKRFEFAGGLDGPADIAINSAGVIYVSTGSGIRKVVLP